MIMLDKYYPSVTSDGYRTKMQLISLTWKKQAINDKLD